MKRKGKREWTGANVVWWTYEKERDISFTINLFDFHFHQHDQLLSRVDSMEIGATKDRTVPPRIYIQRERERLPNGYRTDMMSLCSFASYIYIYSCVEISKISWILDIDEEDVGVRRRSMWSCLLSRVQKRQTIQAKCGVTYFFKHLGWQKGIFVQEGTVEGQDCGPFLRWFRYVQ